MPRRPSPLEAFWVPKVARALCYCCGRRFGNDSEKRNCRVCYDIFCGACLRYEIELPPAYQYDGIQPVCESCKLLSSLFTNFLPSEPTNGAGSLLPPNFAAVVTAEAPVVSSTLGSKLENFFFGKKKSAGKFGDSEQLHLGAFRPLNPDTKIVVGSRFFALSDVRDCSVVVGATVRLLLADDHFVEFAIGCGKDEEDAFGADPIAAAEFATAVRTLLKHCARHFSFSRSAMAIYPSAAASGNSEPA